MANKRYTKEYTGRKLPFHHSAITMGYTPLKDNFKKFEYEGKFGKGYVVYIHSPISIRFCKIEYYIE